MSDSPLKLPGMSVGRDLFPWGCPTPHDAGVRGAAGIACLWQGWHPQLAEPSSTLRGTQLILLKWLLGFPCAASARTSSVTGKGRGRSGKSLQVLLFKLHYSANNFTNAVLGFVVSFLQGPRPCSRTMT